MPKILIIFAALFFYFPVKAQLSPVEEDTAVYNEYDREENTASSPDNNVIPDTAISFRNMEISEDTIAALRKEKGHAWIKNIDSLLRDAQNIRNSARTNTGPSFLEGLFGSSFLKTLLWVLAFCFVGFIIYNLFLSKGFFKTTTTQFIKDNHAEGEDILADDYEPLFRKAYAAGNYKSAMRYLFLQTLQRLNARELIVFSADKTNSMYVNELSVAKRNEFASLALYFEYIRYGNIELSKETFDNIAIKFNAFINKI